MITILTIIMRMFLAVPQFPLEPLLVVVGSLSVVVVQQFVLFERADALICGLTSVHGSFQFTTEVCSVLKWSLRTPKESLRDFMIIVVLDVFSAIALASVCIRILFTTKI